MNVQIIDTPLNVTDSIDCLIKEGVETVFRYYAYDIGLSKVISRKEATAIVSAGLKLGIVYENYNGNQLSSFNYNSGYSDACAAYVYGSETIGQPFGTAIYFAVDVDVTDDQINTLIVPYFEGVRDGLADNAKNGETYIVGVYGCGAVLQVLKAKALCEYRWLSESTAYNGTSAAIENDAYDFRQVYVSGFSICGITEVDEDVLAPEIGMNAIGTITSLNNVNN